MKPYQKAELNFLNIFNEFIGLILSYHILPLQDLYYNPDDHSQIGEIVVYICYISGAVNVTIIFGLAAYGI